MESSTFYTSFFRGTPLLVQIFLFYLGLPQLGRFRMQYLPASSRFSLNYGLISARYSAPELCQCHGPAEAGHPGPSPLDDPVDIVLPRQPARDPADRIAIHRHAQGSSLIS